MSDLGGTADGKARLALGSNRRVGRFMQDRSHG
jgi:hypothetical protein